MLPLHGIGVLVTRPRQQAAALCRLLEAQGASVERAYVLAHESMSAREWSYVAGSRARDAVHFYAERHTANDLERIMGRSQKKDTALDHLPAAAVVAAKTPDVALER